MKEANNQSELAFTGERLMTEIYEYWSIEHLHRYALVLNLIEGKSVVDIASGEGYGTHLMAGKAAVITGIDISEKAVQHAGKKYVRPNLSYVHGSATQMPVETGSIDVITSFETIEHHDEHDKMMQEIKRVLKPGGLLIISSPDKKYYTDMPGYNNPYHVKELYRDEFHNLVKKYFSQVILLNQKTIFGSFISSGKQVNQQFTEFSGGYDIIHTDAAIQQALYNICVASDAPLDSAGLIEHSVFCNQDVFEMYTGLKNRNEELTRINTMLNSKLNTPFQKMIRMVVSPVKKLQAVLKKRV